MKSRKVIIGSKLERKFINLVTIIYEFIFNKYLKIKKMPKLVEEQYALSINNNDYSNYCIVIQGPILHNDNFTKNTILNYMKLYGNINIVLSTWSDEKYNINKEIFKFKNVYIIFSEKPANYGIQNINLQIISTLNGLLKAKELKCKFVLKTRTDQRFYKIDLFKYLDSYLFSYSSISEKLKYKLIVSSLNTYKYRLYGISDMFMYGAIDDVILYWDSILDERESIDYKLSNTQLEFSKLNICEVYLTTNFLKKINHNIEWTLEDSWDIYSSYFIVLSKELLQGYWYKYSRNLEDRFTIISQTLSSDEFTFDDWHYCYYNKNKCVTEKDNQYVNINFQEEIIE